MKKVISILTIVAVLLYAASNFALAYNPDQITITYENADKVTSMGGEIIGIIQVVGSVLAIGVLVVLGIKYMMGSTEEKAEYKKTLIPYLIGAVLIFAAANIVPTLFTWAQNFGK